MPLFFIFIVVPLIELYLLLEVGSIIGSGWVFLLIIATAIINLPFYIRVARAEVNARRGAGWVEAARLAGASAIVAVDLADEKLEAAKEFGATEVLKADMKGLRKAVMALTGGGADHVMVAVGAIAAYAQAPSLACKGGQVVMVGMPPSGAKMEVEPVIVAATAQTLKGSFMGATVVQRDIPYLVEMWRQGRLKLEELVTGRYGFDQINEAIAESRKGHVRRNVLLMDQSKAPSQP